MHEQEDMIESSKPDLLRYVSMSAQPLFSLLRKGVESEVVYERRGSYFTRDDGEGLDITEVVLGLYHKNRIISAHVEGSNSDYKTYFIFLIEDVRNANKQKSLYDQAQNPILN